jgi:hypothetical protein
MRRNVLPTRWLALAIGGLPKSASSDMTATYPLSIQRRVEQKWAERVKRAAETPAKAAGQPKTALEPGVPEARQASIPSGTQRGDRSAA